MSIGLLNVMVKFPVAVKSKIFAIKRESFHTTFAVVLVRGYT